MEPILSTQVVRLQKVEWLSAFVRAHTAVFNARNIHGGFCGTGIYPFLPSKVLNRVAPMAVPTTPISAIPSTPKSILTPFVAHILTSSPLNDIYAMRTANIAVRELMTTSTSIPTPARKYISGLTTKYECVHT